MARGLLLVLLDDPLLERRARRTAQALGLQLASLDSQLASGPGAAQVAQALGLVVELELEGAVELVREGRERWQDLAIVGVLSSPRAELWREAELAGADAVCTRGTLERVLGERLRDRLSGARRARRLRLAPMSEFAGRLGFVGRVEESPVGPIALFHLGGRIAAICDRCPHAGAALSEGELDGEVITCPRHGSQFRVTDGVRVRGPADSDVLRLPVVVEGGVAFVELPQ